MIPAKPCAVVMAGCDPVPSGTNNQAPSSTPSSAGIRTLSFENKAILLADRSYESSQ